MSLKITLFSRKLNKKIQYPIELAPVGYITDTHITGIFFTKNDDNQDFFHTNW